MEQRKVIQIKGSLYVCLPVEVAKGLEVVKGDRCEFWLVPGFGAVIKKVGSAGEHPIPQEAIYQGMSAGKVALHELRRQAAILETTTLKRMEEIFRGQVMGGVLVKVCLQLEKFLVKMVEAKVKPVRVLPGLPKRAKERR